jgi:hypothetical protein
MSSALAWLFASGVARRSQHASDARQPQRPDLARLTEQRSRNVFGLLFRGPLFGRLLRFQFLIAGCAEA